MMPGMPMMPGMMGAPGAAGPGSGGEELKSPTAQVGEELVTKLLSMAASNPQMMMGLALASAGREISQLTGLSKSRSKPKTGAMPPAQAMLAGNSGYIDRLLSLQAFMGGVPGGQPGGMPPGMPPQGGGMPMPGPGMGMGAPMGPGAGPGGPPPIDPALMAAMQRAGGLV